MLPLCRCGAVDVLALDDTTHLCMRCAIAGGFHGYCPLTLRWIGDEGCHCPLQKHFDINPHSVTLNTKVWLSSVIDELYDEIAPETRISVQLVKDGWVKQIGGNYCMIQTGSTLEQCGELAHRSLETVLREIIALHPWLSEVMMIQWSVGLLGIHHQNPHSNVVNFSDLGYDTSSDDENITPPLTNES